MGALARVQDVAHGMEVLAAIAEMMTNQNLVECRDVIIFVQLVVQSTFFLLSCALLGFSFGVGVTSSGFEFCPLLVLGHAKCLQQTMISWRLLLLIVSPQC